MTDAVKTTNPNPATPLAQSRPASGRKTWLLGAAAVAGSLWLAALGHEWFTVGQYIYQTDDAYIQADIATISSQIQGYIKHIPITENQHVSQGDTIATLEDGDYRIALATAQSQVDSQQTSLSRITAQISAAQAAVDLARAQKQSADALLHNAELTATRQRALVASQSTPQSKLDDAESALQQAHAASIGAQAQITSAQANMAVLRAAYNEANSQIRALNLAVDQAQRNLDLTVLRAPYAGVVANLGVQTGDLVAAGQRLAAIVPVDHLYIEANYKETQLAHIAPGAMAHITIGALPGQTFTGQVESIAPATGAMFSILPPTNATGNFTKIVQRVPVRIRISDPKLIAQGVQAGLSVLVKIDSRPPQKPHP